MLFLYSLVPSLLITIPVGQAPSRFVWERSQREALEIIAIPCLDGLIRKFLNTIETLINFKKKLGVSLSQVCKHGARRFVTVWYRESSNHQLGGGGDLIEECHLDNRKECFPNYKHTVYYCFPCSLPSKLYITYPMTQHNSLHSFLKINLILCFGESFATQVNFSKIFLEIVLKNS